MDNSDQQAIASSLSIEQDSVSNIAQSSISILDNLINSDTIKLPETNQLQIYHLYFFLGLILILFINIGPFLYYRLVKKYYMKDVNRQQSSFR